MKNEISPESYGITKFLRENIFQILGFAMLIGNLWLASQLAPLTTDLKVLSTRVLAVENDQSKLVTQAEYQATLKGIEKQLEQINKKLDQLGR